MIELAGQYHSADLISNVSTFTPFTLKLTGIRLVALDTSLEYSGFLLSSSIDIFAVSHISSDVRSKLKVSYLEFRLKVTV